MEEWTDELGLLASQLGMSGQVQGSSTSGQLPCPASVSDNPTNFRRYTRSMIKRCAVTLFLAAAALASGAEPSFPTSRTDQTVDVVHGVKVADPYRWLEDQNSPETRAWIEAQSKYARSLLDKVPGRDRIRARLTTLMHRDEINVPLSAADLYVFTRRLADRNQPDVYVRRGPEGKDELLIDVNKLSPDHTKSVELYSLSRDGRLLAYGMRNGGEDEVILKIHDFEHQRDLADTFPPGRYGVPVFRSDASGFYYNTLTKDGSRIRFHPLGTPVANDKLIFGEQLDRTQGCAIGSGPGSKYLQLTVFHGGTRTDLYLKLLDSDQPFVPVVQGIDANFYGIPAGDKLFIHTDWKAPNGRVMSVNPENPTREFWREIVPEGSFALDSVTATGGRLLLSYLDNASTTMVIHDTDGRKLRTVEAPHFGTATNFNTSDDNHGEVLYQFVSFVTPPEVDRVNLASGRGNLWGSSPIDFQSRDYSVQQVWYESKDKTRVPMFIVMKKGTVLDGSRPALLTGYGGFQVPKTPYFKALEATWVESGGILAVPNLRGGSEFGQEWHKAGMLENKQNVFDDFIGAAEYLIREKYTNSTKLAIIGRSNGGLLVGAAETQRPDLFQAVICGYPLLDMVRYHQFLVAKLWVPEYGSSEDPKQFPYLLKYSPYHNVKPGVNYPATLFVTGDSDTRVAPLHARKMAARLQAVNPTDRPILLLYDTKSGHSAGKPVNAQVEEWTDELSFLFSQLGMSADR